MHTHGTHVCNIILTGIQVEKFEKPQGQIFTLGEIEEVRVKFHLITQRVPLFRNAQVVNRVSFKMKL